jgi:ABC-type arginine transport system ATPase subunit
VRQLALLQLAVERQPLRVQLGLQRVELGLDRLAQERDVHLREHVGLIFQRDQFVGEVAVLQTVVEIDFARLEALPARPPT